MFRESYYSIDCILGWAVSRWYIFFISGVVYLAAGIFGFSFPSIVFYVNNAFFILFGITFIFLSSAINRYLVLKKGEYPNFLMGTNSVIGTFIKLTIGENNVQPNVITNFSKNSIIPKVMDNAYVCDEAVVIGGVYIGYESFIAPYCTVRADMGLPIHIGDRVTLNDGVGLHGIPTEEEVDGVWKHIPKSRYSADGRLLNGDEKNDDGSDVQGYSVWLGDEVLIGHQSFVHGPAWVGENTRIGLQSQINQAKVGMNCYVGDKVLVTQGVVVPDGRIIDSGKIISTQEQADALPSIKECEFEERKKDAITKHIDLSRAYNVRRKHVEMGMRKLIKDGY